MRPVPPTLALLLLPLALLGCAAAKPDSLVSAAMQQDCSVLHLDRGLPYCQALPAAPEPPPFCTRSRGSVDCWRQPPVASPPYRGLADTPAMPPPERQARPWPRFGGEAGAVLREAVPEAGAARLAPLAEPAQIAPAEAPIRLMPAAQPVPLAPVTEPVRLAPVTEPVRLAPVTEPVRLAPVTEPPRLAPVTEPVRLAPVTEPPRLAPAGADRPT